MKKTRIAATLIAVLTVALSTEAAPNCTQTLIASGHPLSFGRFPMGARFSKVDAGGTRSRDCLISKDGKWTECTIKDSGDGVEYGFIGTTVSVKELNFDASRKPQRALAEKTRAVRYLSAKFGRNCWTTVSAPYGNEIYSKKVFRQQRSQTFFVVLTFDVNNELIRIEMKDGDI